MSAQSIQKYAFSLLLNSKNFIQGITKARDSLTGFKALLASSAVITSTVLLSRSLINHYVGLAKSVGRLSEYTDESMRSLQAWQLAIRKSGGDANNFNATLAALNDDMGNLANFGENAAWGMFARLGIGIYKANGALKEGTQLLAELGQAMANLTNVSNRQKVNYLRTMGIDDDTIHLLLEQGKNIDALIKKLQSKRLVDQESYNQAKAWDKVMADIRQNWRMFAVQLGQPLTKIGLEFLTPFMETLTNFLNNNKDAINNALTNGFKWVLEHKGEIKNFFKDLENMAQDALPSIIKLSSWLLKVGKNGVKLGFELNREFFNKETLDRISKKVIDITYAARPHLGIPNPYANDNVTSAIRREGIWSGDRYFGESLSSININSLTINSQAKNLEQLQEEIISEALQTTVLEEPKDRSLRNNS